MKTLHKVLFALCVTTLVVGWLVWPGTGDGQTNPRQEPVQSVPSPDKPPPTAIKPDKVSPASGALAQQEPTKPVKEIPTKEVPARNAFKVLTLVEAIGVAERIGKGQAIKAERKDKPATFFKIEVVGREGKRIVELTADGQLKSNESKSPEKKGEDRRGKEKSR